MVDSFDVTKDQWGNVVLKVPPYQEQDLAEVMRRSEQRGLPLFAAMLVLQERLEAVEAICFTASIPTAKVNGARSQPTAIRRMGRADRVTFGWRLHPQDNKKLVLDREEQETIRRAQFLRAAGLSLREVCRRLDQEGRPRRGKKWQDAHGVLRGVLLRNKQP